MYRALPTLGPACDAHRDQPASDRCVGCEAALCRLCAVYVDLRARCPGCGRRWRRRRRFGRFVLAGFAVALVGGAWALGWRAIRPRPSPAERLGASASEIHALRTRIDVDGCDDPRGHARPARSVAPEAMRLAALYEQNGDLPHAMWAYRLVIACAPDRVAYARLYQLERRLGNWASAGEVLTELLVLEPVRAELLIGRGQARLQTEEAGLAAQDFEWALRLDPRSEAAAEGLRQACMALSPLDANRPSARACAR
jgi:hypothetical protein